MTRRTFLLVLALAGCALDVPEHDHEALRQKGGWCEPCGVGYVRGREFTCRDCYDAYAIEGDEACPRHRKP